MTPVRILDTTMVAEKDIPNPDPNDRVRSGTGPDTHRGPVRAPDHLWVCPKGVVVNTYTTCCHLLQTITWLPGLTDELVSSIAALSEFTKHF